MSSFTMNTQPSITPPTQTSPPPRPDPATPALRYAVLAAVLIPIAGIPYLIARSQASSLRRTVHELQREMQTSLLESRLGLQGEVSTVMQRLDKAGLEKFRSSATYTEKRLEDVESTLSNLMHEERDLTSVQRRVWDLEDRVEQIETEQSEGEDVEDVVDQRFVPDPSSLPPPQQLSLSDHLQLRSVLKQLSDQTTRVAALEAQIPEKDGTDAHALQSRLDSVHHRLTAVEQCTRDHELELVAVQTRFVDAKSALATDVEKLQETTSMLQTEAEAGAARFERLGNIVGSVTSTGEAAYSGASSLALHAKEALDKATGELVEAKQANAALRDHVALLMSERKQNRGQAAMFNDLGASLADLASFIHEMELTWGMAPKGKQVERLLWLAQRMQNSKDSTSGRE